MLNMICLIDCVRAMCLLFLVNGAHWHRRPMFVLCTGRHAAGHASVSSKRVHPVSRSFQKCDSARVGQNLDHEQEGTALFYHMMYTCIIRRRVDPSTDLFVHLLLVWHHISGAVFWHMVQTTCVDPLVSSIHKVTCIFVSDKQTMEKHFFCWLAFSQQPLLDAIRQPLSHHNAFVPFSSCVHRIRHTYNALQLYSACITCTMHALHVQCIHAGHRSCMWPTHSSAQVQQGLAQPQQWARRA